MYISMSPNYKTTQEIQKLLEIIHVTERFKIEQMNQSYFQLTSTIRILQRENM